MSGASNEISIIPEVPTAVRILSNSTIYPGIIVRTALPTVEPISLAQAKNHLRVDDAMTDDDDLISLFITAARIGCEKIQRRTYISSSSYRLSLDKIPNYNQDIIMPYPPLRSVDSGKVYFEDGTHMDIDVAKSIDVDLAGGRIKLNKDYFSNFISANDTIRGYGVFEIEFTCGYGATAADVPADVKVAILLTVNTWYENRSNISDARKIAEIPGAAKAILQHDRVFF